MYTKRSNEQVNHEQEYLIPATMESVQLNKKWQCQIIDQKERKRNARMNEEDDNDLPEQTEFNEDQFVQAIGASALLNNESDGTSSDSRGKNATSILQLLHSTSIYFKATSRYFKTTSTYLNAYFKVTLGCSRTSSQVSR